MMLVVGGFYTCYRPLKYVLILIEYINLVIIILQLIYHNTTEFGQIASSEIRFVA